jgi:hypothetical protein
MRRALLGILGVSTSSTAKNGRKIIHLKHIK